MAKPVYDDGRYMVSSAVVATPSRFYPVSNTTASLRRDPLWAASVFAALACITVAVYGDLLYPVEVAVLLGFSLGAVALTREVLIVRIDAPGHPRIMIVGTRRRMSRLFEAVRDARNADGANPVGSSEREEEFS